MSPIPFCRIDGILIKGTPKKIAAIIDTTIKARKVFVFRTEIRKISKAIHKRIIRNDIGKSIH
jgi:hypothetical protein